MPTFSAIAFDRLLEPGASSKSVNMSVTNTRASSKTVDMPVNIPKPVSQSMPVPEGPTKLERRNSTSVMEGWNSNSSAVERKPQRPLMRPSLYTMPETTPLPDSPTSFPPSSPYIVNHKRRGPRLRLLKSYSDQDVSLHQKSGDEDKLNGSLHQKSEDNGKLNGTADNVEAKVETSVVDDTFTFTVPKPSQVPQSNGVQFTVGNFDTSNGVHKSRGAESGTCSMTNGSAREDDLFQQGGMTPERDSDRDDFFDPKDNMSVNSNTDGEGNSGAEHSVVVFTPTGEYYDAWEELSEGGNSQQQLSGCDLETELREMRLSLVMEIEKRKQAEETLNNFRNQWQRIREQLSLVGLTLPADLTVKIDHGELGSDPASELGQQLYLARFVSNSIGRAIARAEMEAEMESQIEAKNFEISRLWDKLRNYEAMNQEMVQRNQDVIELARLDREKKAKRQRWVWGSIATALTLGTAALAYSYYPSEGASRTHHSEASDSSHE